MKKEILIAVLVLFVGLIFINQMSVLKDTYNYVVEVDAVNYNGYLPLQVENKLIEYGYNYIYDVTYDFYGYLVNKSNNDVFFTLYNVYVYTDLIDMYGYDRVFHLNYIMFDFVNEFIVMQFDNVNEPYFRNIDVYGDIQFLILGYTNYEVK